MANIISANYFICKGQDNVTFEVKAHHLNEALERCKLSPRGSSETYSCRILTDAEKDTMDKAASRKGGLPVY